MQGFFSRILSLYQRIVDESLFVAEQEEAGDEYDEDDQDLVSQLQYCVLDMLHLLFQLEDGADKEAAIAAPADNAPHPFDQQRFLTLLLDDEDNIEVLRSIVHVLLENSKKPRQSSHGRQRGRGRGECGWRCDALRCVVLNLSLCFCIVSLSQCSSTMTALFATARFIC